MANIVDVVAALLKKIYRSAVEKLVRQQFLCLHTLTMICLLRLMLFDMLSTSTCQLINAVVWFT